MRALVTNDARLKVATRAGMVLSCGCGLGRLNRQAWALRDFAVVRCFACGRLALHAKVDLALFDVHLVYSPLREKAAMQRMVLRAIRTDRRAERSRGATPRGLMAQRMGLPSWFTHMDGGGR